MPSSGREKQRKHSYHRCAPQAKRHSEIEAPQSAAKIAGIRQQSRRLRSFRGHQGPGRGPAASPNHPPARIDMDTCFRRRRRRHSCLFLLLCGYWRRSRTSIGPGCVSGPTARAQKLHTAPLCQGAGDGTTHQGGMATISRVFETRRQKLVHPKAQGTRLPPGVRASRALKLEKFFAAQSLTLGWVCQGSGFTESAIGLAVWACAFLL